ncbi:protein kinase superfamily protein [Striga asiatica]|uniref:Protein kinase superfamily protein n=1 Tax=Striga asiatica TaxID=4170 RepID=A0A5A7P9J8_STRAF|nr:protein kinase superfamily protein [Striga asiatica]
MGKPYKRTKPAVFTFHFEPKVPELCRDARRRNIRVRKRHGSANPRFETIRQVIEGPPFLPPDAEPDNLANAPPDGKENVGNSDDPRAAKVAELNEALSPTRKSAATRQIVTTPSASATALVTGITQGTNTTHALCQHGQ